MIEINLLPEELKKKEPRFKGVDLSGMSFENVPVTKIAIILIGVLLALHTLLFVIGASNKSAVNSLSNKYNTLLPQKKESEALKKQLDVINGKVSAIGELMVNRFSWAKQLNSLADSMTPGIWLGELSYEEKVAISQQAASPKKKGISKPVEEKVVLKYMILSGYASSMGEQGTALIGKFIKSLKENPDFQANFSDIELGAIKSEKFQDQEVMSFKITCSFKEAGRE